MAAVELYTDGSSLGNPGPGGYGIILRYGPHEKEMSAGYRHTTNNRMELMALIMGLEALTRPGLEVDVYSDSKYVVDSIEKGWLYGWAKKGFVGKKNADLWQRMIPLLKKHKVRLHWVKGHNNHPMNERCDRLAVAAASGENLMVDTGFNSPD
ncbi:MAG: ribonuclease HI [Chitinophagales bacterium]|nr:ribonuclease HI [Chitinophagales bacterium]